MNSYFWNYLELPTPVILSSPLNCNNAYGAVSKLRSIMVSIKDTLNDLKQLDLEAAALSRLIYRTKYKLRQEKSFKTLQMINRCLTNYLSIHLPFTVNSIQDTLSDDRGPSRQMLEWALVRILSVAHLFHRVHSLCTQAAGHLFVRMKLVHMYEITFFAVSVVSRIWTYAQFIVRKSCEWYSRLYQHLDKLQPSPHPWLPEGAVLPVKLEGTLGNPAYLNLKSVSKPGELISQLDSSVSENDKAQIDKNLPNIFDFDDVGESVPRECTKKTSVIEQEIEELPLHIHRINKSTILKHKNSSEDDHSVLLKKQQLNSEVYSSTIQKNHTPAKGGNCGLAPKTSGASYKHLIESIKSSKDLIQFLQIESDLRESSSKAGVFHKPLLKNCDKLQWSMMERYIKKQIKLLSKSEGRGNLKRQEKLLKSVRKNIKCLQEGSLCAQHCLNALLQGSYFTAVDLAALAQEMDEAERLRMAESGIDSEDYRRFLEQPSGNMDDSGYFSVQVISSALELWGLEMIPYNSTEPRAVEAQNNPAEQKAYICNYRDHWFTIRRLANQWFNLNSLLTGPELISNTYLAMFLAQLQQEGYSIFVVCGDLPPCTADEVLLLRPAVQAQKPKLLSEVAKSQPQSQDSDDSELQKAIRMSLGQDEVVELVDPSPEEDEEEQIRQAVLLSLQSQTPTCLPEVDPVELRQRRLAYLENAGTKVNT